MGISEIVAMVIVYSSLSIYYIVPFRKPLTDQNVNQSNRVTFAVAYKESIKNLLFHKRAIIAYLLLIFSVVMIWFDFQDMEYYTNAHSGYPPISMDLEAILSMIVLFVYTIFLYLVIGLVSAIHRVKIMKK